MSRFGQNYENGAAVYPNDRIFIMHDLEHVGQGETVVEWPLHCTLICPFYPTEAFALSSLLQVVKGALQSLPVIHAEHAGNAQFGPEEDIPVALLASTGVTSHGEPIENGALELLHRRLMLAMHIGVTGYAGSEMLYHSYNPHVALPDSVAQITPFAVDTLSIAVKDGGTGEKHIAAVVDRG